MTEVFVQRNKTVLFFLISSLEYLVFSIQAVFDALENVVFKVHVWVCGQFVLTDFIPACLMGSSTCAS